METVTDFRFMPAPGNVIAFMIEADGQYFHINLENKLVRKAPPEIAVSAKHLMDLFYESVPAEVINDNKAKVSEAITIVMFYNLMEMLLPEPEAKPNPELAATVEQLNKQFYGEADTAK